MGHLVGIWPLLLASLLAAQAADRPAIDQTAVDSTMRELADATGFAIRKPVAFQVLSRLEVNRFLNKRIKDAIKPAEIRAEELTLKKFGFVPPDFDLQKTTIALLTEQTAAFYDFRRKRLFLTDWASPRLRQVATIHELAHALADQNFPLERFAKRVEQDSEKAAARQAVVEGQASWLMRDLGKRHPERASEPDEEPPSEVFDKAPLYFRETLTFPYNQGTEFQQAVFARLGKDSFRHVFEHPPVSTQQIIHPDLYFAGQQPLQISLPALRGMRRLVEGALGELEHAVLLRQYATSQDAAELSPRWRGARYQLWENRKSKRVALVYRSAWQSPQSAQRFFDLYKQVIRRKWKKVAVMEETASRFSGFSEDGYFLVECEQNLVTSREGLEAEN